MNWFQRIFRNAATAANEPRLKGQVRFIPMYLRSVDTADWRNAIEAYKAATPRPYDLQAIYEQQLLSDAHLASEVQKRRLAITTCLVSAKVGGIDFDLTKVAPMGQWQELFGQILDARLFGWTLLDFDPERLDWELLPRANYAPHKRAIYLDGIGSETPLENFPTVACIDTKTPGLLATATYWSIYKRNGMIDFAQYAEMYGMPIQDISYSGNDPKIKEELKYLLQNQGSRAGLVLPEGVEVNTRNGANSAANEVYTSLIETCNAEISKVIVGQTMTTTDGSSYSQAKVHHQIYQAFNAADRTFCEMLFHKEVYPVLQRLYRIPEGMRFSLYEDEAVDRGQLIEQDVKLATLIQLPEKWLRERYGIPEVETQQTQMP